MAEINDVLEFHYRFGVRTDACERPHLPTDDVARFRVGFMQEELDELRAALRNGDLPEVLDALVDLDYVLKGTALLLGITPSCWHDAWSEVHARNMEKVRVQAADESKRKNHLDIRKPADWQPPQLAEVLLKHGWKPDNEIK